MFVKMLHLSHKILYTACSFLQYWGLHMQLEKAISQIKHTLEGGLKKRFACAHCGMTWVEIVGVFASSLDGKEDVYLHVGEESEVCQNCKLRIRSCPVCGSKDAYEVNFPLKETQNTPLSFDRIRVVNNP